LRLSCAGHQPPLLVRESGEVGRVPVDAVPPLLLMELGDVPSSDCVLRGGDRLLLYTDGITDRESPDGTMYEEGRLTAALGKVATRRPSEAIDALVADLDAFAGGREPRDDQTLVLIGFS
jgi:serine phosphatase RsbU (regulator of sigma subunit)